MLSEELAADVYIFFSNFFVICFKAYHISCSINVYEERASDIFAFVIAEGFGSSRRRRLGCYGLGAEGVFESIHDSCDSFNVNIRECYSLDAPVFINK
jgi:hypothetical protein